MFHCHKLNNINRATEHDRKKTTATTPTALLSASDETKPVHKLRNAQAYVCVEVNVISKRIWSRYLYLWLYLFLKKFKMSYTSPIFCISTKLWASQPATAFHLKSSHFTLGMKYTIQFKIECEWVFKDVERKFLM